MKRAILLLDGQCSPCSEVGRQIQVEGLTEDSILEIGSLHDPRYREMVDRVRPNGKLEPTLLHLDGPAVSASTGVKLVASLLRIVGLRRSFRIAQLVREATADPAFDPSRRSFLIKAAGAAAVLPVVGMLGAKTATATVSEPSPLTALEAQAAYTLLLASSEYAAAHQAAAADGLQHRRSATLQTLEDGFVGDSCAVFLSGEDNGHRLVMLLLSYVDGLGNRADRYFMQAAVELTNKAVVAALHVDASEAEEPVDETRAIAGEAVKQTVRNVVVPADSVTPGLANVRGAVLDTIEVRINSPWHITRDGESVPVELIRIVPGANLIEVDENAELATTTHGLSGYEIRITQTDGTNTYSVNGVLGAANLGIITDAALGSLAVDRETTVHIGSQGQDTYNELKFDMGETWEVADTEVSHLVVNLRNGAITVHEQQNKVGGDLEGYTLVVTQGASAISGVLDDNNTFADAALASFVAGAAVTVTVRSTIAAPPAGATSAPAGTLRLKGRGVDAAVTNGSWSGTPVPGARAAGARDDDCWTEFWLCVATPVILAWETVCRWLGVLFGSLCTLVAVTASMMVCNLYLQWIC